MKIITWEEVENIGYKKAIKEIIGVLEIAIVDKREIPNSLLKKLLEHKNKNK